MLEQRIERQDEAARPFVYLGFAVLLMSLLIGVSVAGGGGSKELPNDPNTKGGSRPMVHMIPGSPLPSSVGSPIKDAPSIGIVHTVREIMHRYPDRNLPKDWPDPAAKKSNPR